MALRAPHADAAGEEEDGLRCGGLAHLAAHSTPPGPWVRPRERATAGGRAREGPGRGTLAYPPPSPARNRASAASSAGRPASPSSSQRTVTASGRAPPSGRDRTVAQGSIDP